MPTTLFAVMSMRNEPMERVPSAKNDWICVSEIHNDASEPVKHTRLILPGVISSAPRFKPNRVKMAEPVEALLNRPATLKTGKSVLILHVIDPGLEPAVITTLFVISPPDPIGQNRDVSDCQIVFSQAVPAILANTVVVVNPMRLPDNVKVVAAVIGLFDQKT